MTGLDLSPEECIADLDEGLAEAETIELWRPSGLGGSVTYTKVTCAAVVRVYARGEQAIGAGIEEMQLLVTISPTEINAAGWPGTSPVGTPPFTSDPRIPLIDVDKVAVQGQMRTVKFVEPIFVQGTLVRINMRVS